MARYSQRHVTSVVTVHVLSDCKLMLDQGRYTWHHEITLNKITEFINQVNDSDLIINVDPGEKPWTIPPDLLVTSDRPDLVVIDMIISKMYLNI